MNNIALFGGSFDPIGLHHEEIVEKVYEKTGMITWIMPCYGHVFEKGSRLAAPSDRLEMVTRACYHRKTHIAFPFDWEIEHKHSGSMFETINQLKIEYPDNLFHIVIGMDNAEVIESKWLNGQELIEQNPFIIFNRRRIGFKTTTDWFFKEPHRIYSIESTNSSTDIRNAIEHGGTEFVNSHLNPAVLEYIKEKTLYGYNYVR